MIRRLLTRLHSRQWLQQTVIDQYDLICAPEERLRCK